LLVGFDLGDEKASGIPGRFKGFPDYALFSACRSVVQNRNT
jgi:hypothetical protein